MLRQYGERVNGAGGNFGGMMANTTGAPVGFNPYNQLQRSVMSADPMNQMGNSGYFNNTEVAGGPALPGEPGKNPIPTAPGGRPHLPGEKQTPLPGRFQAKGSSNLPTAMPQSRTTFGVGNNEGLVANAAFVNPMLGGKGGRENFTNAVTNPIEFLLGGEGGKKEFQNINVEDLLKGGRSNASDGNEQRLLQAMQYGRLNGSIPTFNQGGVAT